MAPARKDIPQWSVHQAILRQLRTALDLAPAQCYPVIRAEDVPVLPAGGDYFLTVAWEPGIFPQDEEQWTGACEEQAAIIITIYTRIHLDPPNSDDHLLWDATKGLAVLKRKVLKAMIGQDLTDTDGAPFLRQLIHARSSGRFDSVKVGSGDGVALGMVQLTFGVSFDHDLTS
jgi:hypothetical protein